jgi:hypothetical protein
VFITEQLLVELDIGAFGILIWPSSAFCLAHPVNERVL